VVGAASVVSDLGLHPVLVLVGAVNMTNLPYIRWYICWYIRWILQVLLLFVIYWGCYSQMSSVFFLQVMVLRVLVG
jgi:hypothetical protein